MNENTVYEISKIRDIINLYERSNSSPAISTSAVQNQLKKLLREDDDNNYNDNNDAVDDDDDFNKYALEVYRLFYCRKHHLVFAMLKKYNLRLKTGVFKTSQYIVKYDSYIDTRQLLTYRKLGFGINSEIKIVTPIWYYIFDSGYSGYKNAAIPSSSVSDDADSDAETNNSSAAAGGANDGAVKINIDQLRTLEIQPLLLNSTPLHKWYRSAHISMKDHDFIVASIMLSIAKSIKHCHDKNLVHGDIKPDNVLIVNGPVSGSTAASFTVRRTTIPETYLIDFGMCGCENTDTGTGGTRPYCAPETTNVDGAMNHRAGVVKKMRLNDEVDDYTWCKMTKAQDIWSFGLMLFTMITFSNLYYYYNEFPKRVFDTSGYVRISELASEPEIGAHTLYPVFEKTLCAPDNRASIDEIIQLMTIALTSL